MRDKADETGTWRDESTLTPEYELGYQTGWNHALVWAGYKIEGGK